MGRSCGCRRIRRHDYGRRSKDRSDRSRRERKRNERRRRRIQRQRQGYGYAESDGIHGLHGGSQLYGQQTDDADQHQGQHEHNILGRGQKRQRIHDQTSLLCRRSRDGTGIGFQRQQELHQHGGLLCRRRQRVRHFRFRHCGQRC